MRMKVSVLSDISIYTTDGEGAIPLKDVMTKIHEEFAGDTDLTAGSDPEELKSFLKHVLPNYDDSRVYVSDIKKLVTWYNTLAADYPELLVASEEAPASDEKSEEKAETEEKKKD